MENKVLLSEYEEGTRKAKVYLTKEGYKVIVNDTEGHKKFSKYFFDENSADEYAEDWVLKE